MNATRCTDATDYSEYATEIRPGHNRASEIRRLQHLAASLDEASIVYTGRDRDARGVLRYTYTIRFPSGKSRIMRCWSHATAREEAEHYGWLWID